MSVNTNLIAGHKIIVDPENTHEVSRVIGRASLDVATLCAAGSQYVNKWARYKPVKNSANNYQSQLKGGSGSDKNQWATTATWWKAADGKCGLSVTKRTTGSALVSNWSSEWAYDAITINSTTHVASHWCRLTDFNYYDHNANPPVFVGYPTQYQINQSQNLTVQFQAYNGNPYALMLTDFTAGVWDSTKQMYCGVLVVYGIPNSSYSNMTKVSVVNGTPLGTNLSGYGMYNRDVVIPYSLMPTYSPSDIFLYPFLCQNSYSNQSKGANEDVGWEYGVVACPVDFAMIQSVVGYIIGAISGVTCNYGQGGNSVQLKFTYSITGGGGGFSKNALTAWLYVLDNDTDTSGQYPEYTKKNGHRIISYGSSTTNGNPLMGQSFGSITVSDGHTETFNQTTLMRDVSEWCVVGLDAATYASEYRAKHGSGAVKCTLVIEFHDNDNGIYGQSTISDVTISNA